MTISFLFLSLPPPLSLFLSFQREEGVDQPVIHVEHLFKQTSLLLHTINEMILHNFVPLSPCVKSRLITIHSCPLRQQ